MKHAVWGNNKAIIRSRLLGGWNVYLVLHDSALSSYDHRRFAVRSDGELRKVLQQAGAPARLEWIEGEPDEV